MIKRFKKENREYIFNNESINLILKEIVEEIEDLFGFEFQNNEKVELYYDVKTKEIKWKEVK